MCICVFVHEFPVLHVYECFEEEGDRDGVSHYGIFSKEFFGRCKPDHVISVTPVHHGNMQEGVL